jgi:predicted amidohydrolase
MIRIATAAYPPELLPSFAVYAAKIAAWVEDAARAGAHLLVFPEYAAMELAGPSGVAVAGDLRGSLAAVMARMPGAVALHADLARRHGVHILMGSGPVQEGARIVNRAHLLTPSGAVAHQDKQIMTRFEREDWGIAGGGPLRVFDTALGRIGVLICYDSEFPLLGRALVEAGVEILLVPSCTELNEGYWRVRIGAMARALEGQCAAVMASLVGRAPELFAIEENCGAGGIFGPPDRGFPADGVIALGGMDVPGWTIADIDPAAIATLRADGHVLNVAHWPEQVARLDVERVAL